jgi:hypothetical protein
MYTFLYWITLIIVGLTLSQFVYSADSTVNYKNQPPPSAISPSPSIGSGSDVCVVVRSGAIQSSVIGISGGTHVIDKNCIMLKNARMLASLGLKVSATALMCENKAVWRAMIMSGTPCPIYGKIGSEALTEYIKIGRLNENGTINESWNPMRINIRNGDRRNYGQPVN